MPGHRSRLAKSRRRPLAAILFGGRRPHTIPLANEAFNWEHGVFLGSSCGSETTAAAIGQAGVLRRDPFAMLPFCGYSMADYFKHWLSFADRTDRNKLPKIYFVNWFRKDDSGRWLWPGYGENSRVLKWICERVEGVAQAQKTPIGNLPAPEAIDVSGLDLPKDDLKTLTAVDPPGGKRKPKISRHIMPGSMAPFPRHCGRNWTAYCNAWLNSGVCSPFNQKKTRALPGAGKSRTKNLQLLRDFACGFGAQQSLLHRCVFAGRFAGTAARFGLLTCLGCRATSGWFLFGRRSLHFARLDGHGESG
jgi:hypothetical protein